MIARGPLWLPLAILVFLAGLTFWIERAVQTPGSGGPTAPSDPEGIMENFDAMRTDPDGNPQYRLSARRLKHYTGSKLTEMESPRFVHLDPKIGEVSAASQQATVSPEGDEVTLRGEVSVMRAARPGQSAMTLRTARLIVYPERGFLRAPGAVSLRDSSLDVRAAAMEYDVKKRVIRLAGRVHARFEPAKE